MTMDYIDIKKEILQASYIEHFKTDADFSKFLDHNHPKRKKLQKEYNMISQQLKDIKDFEKNIAVHSTNSK